MIYPAYSCTSHNFVKPAIGQLFEPIQFMSSGRVSKLCFDFCSVWTFSDSTVVLRERLELTFPAFDRSQTVRIPDHVTIVVGYNI
jgi:hypothetical protein